MTTIYEIADMNAGTILFTEEADSAIKALRAGLRRLGADVPAHVYSGFGTQMADGPNSFLQPKYSYRCLGDTAERDGYLFTDL
jgi:hypothetical protein